ncbi:hypothetical protein jhhlp_007690 [Lomentospora prolificans]|uniref:Pre-mRNA-splicing factor CWC26 n=1 Tax=Lomentospora prolificans TaxID=41688 RepID=A0A2N3N0A7_9PEZI|nr:hypothetical protein jhhlp_007690 [Lomentospora prolificans]
MPPTQDSYIAAHYLVADPKPTKKRKRKAAPKDAGLVIAEEDEFGWAAHDSRSHVSDDNDDPVVVAGTSSEFRKTKTSNWKPLDPEKKAPRMGDATAADAIIASAAAEQRAANLEADEMPALAEDSYIPKMSDGTHAGLQSAASVAAQLETRHRQEREDFIRSQKNGEEETAYRDAAGNRIDISMRRAQARKAALEAEAKERRMRDTLKGEIQKEETRRNREMVQDAKFMPLARTADDTEMNRELRERERWNDPMMRFLGNTQRQASVKKTNRPTYDGPSLPNRYGIRPGYRWDGVDRSNGFEAERFKSLNKRNMNKELEYSWQIDV